MQQAADMAAKEEGGASSCTTNEKQRYENMRMSRDFEPQSPPPVI